MWYFRNSSFSGFIAKTCLNSCTNVRQILCATALKPLILPVTLPQLIGGELFTLMEVKGKYFYNLHVQGVRSSVTFTTMVAASGALQWQNTLSLGKQ